MARTAGYRYTGNGETMEYQEGQDIHQWLWDMEKRYDAGLYNGESIPTTPGAVKVPGGWDLGPDPTYQAKLRQLYGEEDYALLNAPIRWERVPNIIGMDEQTGAQCPSRQRLCGSGRLSENHRSQPGRQGILSGHWRWVPA